jgi:hypothetical protein
MADPQYAWQRPERYASPLHDLTDQEFEQRLEQFLEQQEEMEGKTTCPMDSTPATSSAVKALTA